MTRKTLAAPPDSRACLPRGAQRYRGRALANLAFPLGGIGAGCVSLGGWGQLRDFEWFNRPAKGLMFNHTFFTIHARWGRDGSESWAGAAQGRGEWNECAGAGDGVPRFDGSGLPRLGRASFASYFPFARVEFEESPLPLRAALEAWSPFIPHEPDDSSLPAALFHFLFRNPPGARGAVDLTLFANLENKLGWPETGGGRIEALREPGLAGLVMSTRRHAPDSPRFGTLALLTPHSAVSLQTHWIRGAWFDSLQRFWDHARRGVLEENEAPAEREDGTDIGSIALRVRLRPGESARLPVWLIWHLPNFEMYWSRETPRPRLRNPYAARFADAAAIGRYLAREAGRLERDSRRFAAALHASTLPAPALDAIASQLSILKSPTCLRLEDGTFYAFEGCHADGGCCEGTCSHVWNYAQSVAWMFPSLERSAREAEFQHAMREDGHLTIRLPLPLGRKPEAYFHAAADGQFGEILRLYREWRVCGDSAWLRRLWPCARRALEYAWSAWDPGRDGLCGGAQHNTYDIEFHGPNPLVNTLYLAALRAAEEMARHLGDDDFARACRGLFTRGARAMDARLYNGEYYIQNVEYHPDAPPDSVASRACAAGGGRKNKARKTASSAAGPKYQVGPGCLSDQMIGQWLARALDLGDLLPPAHVRSALRAIFRHNWRPRLGDHANCQRIYALADEPGLLLATWPRGGRPEFPFPYCDEVWPGIEYQVAAHMIHEGLVEEGLKIAAGTRSRHTGERRNPWDEVECGHHYARSLASWALLPALSGFSWSAPDRALAFAPRWSAERFRCFFATGAAWGTYRQSLAGEPGAAGERRFRARIEIAVGTLALSRLQVSAAGRRAAIRLGGRRLGAADAEMRRERGPRRIFHFHPALEIAAGETLSLAIE